MLDFQDWVYFAEGLVQERGGGGVGGIIPLISWGNDSRLDVTSKYGSQLLTSHCILSLTMNLLPK